MQNNWFYIQQWKMRRWSYIGKELDFDDAKFIFNKLIDDMDNYNSVKPIACVKKEDKYKIVLEPESDWNIVMCNAIFLMDDKNDDGLKVQRVAK